MPCAKCKLSRKGITHCLERGHDKPRAVVKDEDDGPHLMQCSQCKLAHKGMQHCIERGHVLQLKATVDVDHDETAPMLVRCALCKQSRKGVKHCIRKGHVLQSEAEVEGENDETPCLMQCSQCKGSRKGIKYCIERGHTVQAEAGMNDSQTHIDQQDMTQQKKCADDRNVLLRSGLRETNLMSQDSTLQVCGTATSWACVSAAQSDAEH